MAQLVARDVWDVDAAGSNPVTPTKIADSSARKPQSRDTLRLFEYDMLSEVDGMTYLLLQDYERQLHLGFWGVSD